MNRAALIVDDDADIRTGLSLILRKNEVECGFAASAQEALEILKHQHFGLVFTDLKMPEMDGLETEEGGVIVLAATNQPEVLDAALLRPGRFDRQVVVPNPDIVGREKILKVHAKKITLGPNVNLRTIARGTPGFYDYS